MSENVLDTNNLMIQLCNIIHLESSLHTRSILQPTEEMWHQPTKWQIETASSTLSVIQEDQFKNSLLLMMTKKMKYFLILVLSLFAVTENGRLKASNGISSFERLDQDSEKQIWYGLMITLSHILLTQVEGKKQIKNSCSHSKFTNNYFHSTYQSS